jgi:uncharacterized protein with PQ loop repeat
VYFAVLKNFFSGVVILDLFCSLPQVVHVYNKVGNAKVLYISSLIWLVASAGFKVLLMFSISWRNFDILAVMYF